MTGNNQTIRLPLWGTALTVTGLIILCGLGYWQLQRLAWKSDVLNKLDAAYAGQSEPADLEQQNFEEGSFIYGRAKGVVLADKALLLGPRTKDDEIGHDVIVPIKTATGTIIIVNLGWSNMALKELPIQRLNNQTIWLEGIARAPSWNHFTPENEPDNDRWYKADLVEIAKVKNLPLPKPFMLYAERASDEFGAALPNNERWSPNNNHMQYALFWFAMAAAMAGVYALRFLRRG